MMQLTPQFPSTSRSIGFALCHLFQVIVNENADEQNRKNSPEKKGDSKTDVVLNMPVPEMHSVGGVLVHMPHVRYS